MLVVGAAVTTIPAERFTLAWTHSIEKLRWEEDYRIEGGAFRLVEARIRGSGAGMEPPEDARLERGVWHYTPALPRLPVLRLTQSHYAQGYELCLDGICAALAARLPKLPDGVVELTACDRADASGAGAEGTRRPARP